MAAAIAGAQAGPEMVRRIQECTYTARKHDAEAIRHLLRRPCGGLLEDPGCGKTGQIYAAFQILKKKKLVDKMLVLAPLNPVYEVWSDVPTAELSKWGFPFTTTILHGDHKNERLDEKTDIYAINYDGLPWLSQNIKRLVKPKENWWLVIDESTKVKHSNTARFKALRPLLHLFARRTILTGTPNPNGMEDLFGQVYCVDLGASLGRYVTHYRREFFYPTGYGGYTWALQDDAEKRIYDRLGDMFYRVSDDVLDLPPHHRIPLYVKLPKKARKIYDEFEETFVAELESGVVTAANAGVKSSKLRQIANGQLYDGDGISHVIHDAKLDAVTDFVEDLQGKPVLIGYEFTADGERLADTLKMPLINSATSRKDKSAAFAKFNNGKLAGIVCQSGAAALGLNLQKACRHILRYGLPWDLEVDIQFGKRVHRSGQQQTVIDHHIMAHDTMDDVVWKVLSSKNRNQKALLDAVQKRYMK
jgi:SNF2 family DNA or RNA helicase